MNDKKLQADVIFLSRDSLGRWGRGVPLYFYRRTETLTG